MVKEYSQKEIKNILKECKDAVSYFIHHGFINELSSDDYHYTNILIKYFKDRRKPYQFKQEYVDAIEYTYMSAENQTTDKKHYMLKLAEFCNNF